MCDGIEDCMRFETSEGGEDEDDCEDDCEDESYHDGDEE